MKILLPLLFLLCGCSLLQLPRDYDYVANEHIVILKNDSTIDDSRYEEVLNMAEEAYLYVKEILNIKIDITIFITISGDDETSGRSAAAGSNFILVNRLYFLYFDTALYATLTHEITHNFIYNLYGSTNSFLFTEGIADWVKYGGKPVPDLSLLYLIYDLFSVTEQENIANSPLFEKYTHELYVLAASFTAYYIKHFSLESFFRIYSTVSTSNYRKILEEETGQSFQTLISSFIQETESENTFFIPLYLNNNKLQSHSPGKRGAASLNPLLPGDRIQSCNNSLW